MLPAGSFTATVAPSIAPVKAGNVTVTPLVLIALTDATLSSALGASTKPVTAALRASVAAFTCSKVASAVRASAAAIASFNAFADSSVLPSVESSLAAANAVAKAF